MPTLERRRSGGAARGATERIRPRRRVKADAPRSDAFSRARRGLAEAGGLLYPTCFCLVDSLQALSSGGGGGVPRTVNGTGHTDPSEFCATSI